MTDIAWNSLFVFLAAAFAAWLAYLTKECGKAHKDVEETKRKANKLERKLNGGNKAHATKGR